MEQIKQSCFAVPSKLTIAPLSARQGVDGRVVKTQFERMYM